MGKLWQAALMGTTEVPCNGVIDSLTARGPEKGIVTCDNIDGVLTMGGLSSSNGDGDVWDARHRWQQKYGVECGWW